MRCLSLFAAICLLLAACSRAANEAPANALPPAAPDTATTSEAWILVEGMTKVQGIT
jgi:hypothetical protein